LVYCLNSIAYGNILQKAALGLVGS
jgi:hypothetical protein